MNTLFAAGVNDPAHRSAPARITVQSAN